MIVRSLSALVLAAATAVSASAEPLYPYPWPDYSVLPILFSPTDWSIDSPEVQQEAAALEIAMAEIQDFYRSSLGGNTFRLNPLQVVQGFGAKESYHIHWSGNNIYTNGVEFTGNMEHAVVAELHQRGFPTPPAQNESGYSVLIFMKGAGGYAGGRELGGADGGWAILGDWCIDSIQGAVEEGQYWWSGRRLQTGAAAHELGHTFGLPHPDAYNGDWTTTVMGEWWRYPNTGLNQWEKDALAANKANFFSSESPTTGDFDRNGIVNSVDLLIWRESYGSSEFLAADGDVNGRVDGHDYLAWQRRVSAVESPPIVSTMAALRTLPNGTNVAVAGTITTMTDLIDSTSFKSFYLQDETGGIHVFGSNDRIDDLLQGASPGKKVVLSGVLGSHNGALQITPNSASRSVVVDEPGTPAPIDVSIVDLANFSSAAEQFENMLVRLSNVSFASGGTFNGLTNYTLTDGNSTAIVRVSTTQLDLVGEPIPAGPVDVVGLLAQFDSRNPAAGVPGVGYQLYVRSLADVTPHSPGRAAAAPTGSNVPEPSGAAWALACAGCLLRCRPYRLESIARRGGQPRALYRA